MTLTGRTGLVAVAGGLVIAVFGTGVASLIVNAAILAALAADLLFAASIAGLQVSRSGETKIGLGQTGTTTLTLINSGHRRLRGVIRDGWRPSAVAQPGRSRIDLPAGRRVTVTTTLTPSRRGDVAAGLVTIRSFGPLGLAGRQRSLAAPFTVRVLPAFLSRKHLPAVVRTWRPERDRRIVIVLDTGRTSAGRVGGIPRLDASMDAALLLTAVAVRAGDRADLIAADRRVRARVVGAGRGDVLAAFTSEMALLEPDLIEPDIGLMTATVLGIARQRCLVVLLTDLNPAAIEEGLLPHIQLLSARHQVLLAAVADPRVAEMAADRGDPGAIYAAAAAIAAQAERSRIAALLRRHGVEVVDAPPDRLPPALADAYLSLKAAGRL